MTILPTKRASPTIEDKSDATQNVTSERRREQAADANKPTTRRPFRRSATPEPTEHCMLQRKRFKESTKPPSRRKLARERDRQQRSGGGIGGSGEPSSEENSTSQQAASTSQTTPATTKTTKTTKATSVGSGGGGGDEANEAPNDNPDQDGDDATGFNSEDEYGAPIHNPSLISDEEWKGRDARFARCLSKLGFEIKQIRDDGACLFRAIADQIYGDQELHFMVRSSCMDYIVKNKDFFANYVTEDFDKYVARKRLWNVHGNHLEIQAMSEMYNRTIEVYCYEVQPINIFNSPRPRLPSDEPIRLSYHRMCHYNSICNPNNPSVGVGLGLPAYHPIDLNRRRMVDAVRASEDIMIEQTMLEDKLKATDWEATYEAIEEEVARESYIQYFRDAEKRLKPGAAGADGHGHLASSSSTITSAVCCAASPRQSPKSSKAKSPPQDGGSAAGMVDGEQMFAAGSAPKSSHLFEEFEAIYNNAEYQAGAQAATDNDKARPENNWDDGIMAQVLAESRKTYFDELKRKTKKQGSPGPSTSR